ncbi:MAG: hypothetical protein MUC88_11995 [Planctomycetes bacterium]|nr:hypothetical protein [Planctomycetota bacterium]
MKFEEARRLAPQDMILPFAYAQALFADGHYDKAAEILRAALRTVSSDQQGVFFPRGLYANDDVLFGQIEKLLDKIDRSEGDEADLQLLLGYQLLGVGETGHARDQLEQARAEPRNAESATILLNLAEKMEKEAGAALKTDEEKDDTPPAAAGNAPDGGIATPTAATPTATTVTATAEAPAESVAPAPTAPVTPLGAALAPSAADQPEAPKQEPAAGSTPAVKQPAGEAGEDRDMDGTGVLPPGDDDTPTHQAGFLEGMTAPGIGSGVARFLTRDAPNYRVDIVAFVSILSLALAGLWIEWRLPSRRPTA